MLCRLCRLLLACLCLAAVASAAPIKLYVAPQGNDCWTGLLPQPNARHTDGPLASLQAARDTIRRLRAEGRREPAIVQIAPGIYRLPQPLVLQPQDSDITFLGVENAPRPVISGGRLIAGWRLEQPGLWSAPLQGLKDLRLLFVNSRRAILARSPNEGYFRIAGRAAPFQENGKERDSAKQAFRFRPGDLANWPDLQHGNVVVFFHWETGLLRLQSVDETTHTVTLTGEMKWPFWGNQRYYVENVRAALDAPGEFYPDEQADRIYYRPRPGEDMRRAEVVAPTLTQLVLLQGDPAAGLPIERVSFRHLSFQHTNYVLEPEGHCDWQAAVTINAAIQANGARECVIDDCEISRLGNYAVWFASACQNNRVTRNHIFNCSAGGVRVGEPGVPPSERETRRNEIINNFIHDLGLDFYGAVGVWIGHASENLIAHNEICDTNYTAISCGWSWGFAPTKHHHNRIEFNYLHDIGRGRLCDMGAIYTLGLSEGTTIRHNLIHDVWDWAEGYGAGGIYPDEGSSGLLIEKNVVYRTASGGLTIHYGRNIVAQNNIFAFGRDSQIHLGRRDMNSSLTFQRNIVYYEEGQLFVRESDLVADYNIYYNTAGETPLFPNNLDFAAWQAQGQDRHSLLADPRFVDPKHYDFRLRPDSPARRLGFEPIDVRLCGLTVPEWQRLAQSIPRRPFPIPRRAEAPPREINDGFENTPVNAQAENAVTYGEAGSATIRVTDERAAAGKHSLKFMDAPGLDQPWNPHLFYSPNQQKGRAICSFDLWLEPGAIFWHEWRDASYPYLVGPSLGVNANRELQAAGQTLLTLPLRQWIHFEITAGLGPQADGTWSLSISWPGQSPQRFEKLPCDRRWKALMWLGFVSNATDAAVFYLDNLRLRVANAK